MSENNKPLPRWLQLGNKLFGSGPVALDEININEEFSTAVEDLKDSLLKLKDTYGHIGMLVAVTALFISIETTDVYLKRTQAFLLLLSVFAIVYLCYSAVKVMFTKKASEMYGSIAVFIAVAASMFVFNLIGYVMGNFYDEYMYYLHQLGAPIIGISVNLACIYFFRLIKKFGTIEDGWQIKNFFLVTLNLHLVISYVSSHFDLVETIHRLTAPTFSNLLIAHYFFLSLYSELRSFSGFTFRRAILETLIFVALLVAPYVIYFGIVGF